VHPLTSLTPPYSIVYLPACFAMPQPRQYNLLMLCRFATAPLHPCRFDPEQTIQRYVRTLVGTLAVSLTLLTLYLTVAIFIQARTLRPVMPHWVPADILSRGPAHPDCGVDSGATSALQNSLQVLPRGAFGLPSTHIDNLLLHEDCKGRDGLIRNANRLTNNRLA